MQFYAGCVLRKYRCLQRPNPVSLGLFYQSFKQRTANPSTSALFADRNTQLRYSAISVSFRDSTQSSPTQNSVSLSRHEPGKLKMAGIPVVPRRSIGFESRVACSNALEIDGPDLFPIARYHLVDNEVHRLSLSSKCGQNLKVPPIQPQREMILWSSPLFTNSSK